MYPNQRGCALQQRRVQHHASKTDSYTFFNLLTGPDLLDEVEALLPEHRERLFPPTETLSMFLAQAMNADRSCQNVVNSTAVHRLSGGLPRCSTHTGGYCHARQRLPVDMISTLTRHTGHLIAANTPTSWHWRNRPVRLVDGTTVSLADTPANQAAYPQPRSQQPGLGYPLCRLVGLICLGSGALLNAAAGAYRGKGGDEQSLLRSLLDTLASGDILIGDAFFANYFLLCRLREQGVDAVFEQHGSRQRCTDFRCGERLGTRDHLIVLNKPKRRPDWMSEEAYAQAPETVTVRELRAHNKTLVTTLLCPKRNPKAALSALYKSRWNVELDLRAIKTTLGMETLRCKTPAMADKEIWGYLLAYNLIRLLMAQAALLADCLPRQLSFKHTLQVWIAWGCCGIRDTDTDKISVLFILIAQRRVGDRPGRIEPRALKRRPKSFPLLTMPRGVAQANVAKHGHPRKLK